MSNLVPCTHCGKELESNCTTKRTCPHCGGTFKDRLAERKGTLNLILQIAGWLAAIVAGGALAWYDSMD